MILTLSVVYYIIKYMGILKIINLEFGRPTVDEALKRFGTELKNAKNTGVGCLQIIHGYGSHGKGGLIRVAIREDLEKYKNKYQIKTIVYGEDFKILNNDANRLRHKYEELEPLFHMTNKGVTVVELG